MPPETFFALMTVGVFLVCLLLAVIAIACIKSAGRLADEIILMESSARSLKNLVESVDNIEHGFKKTMELLTDIQLEQRTLIEQHRRGDLPAPEDNSIESLMEKHHVRFVERSEIHHQYFGGQGTSSWLINYYPTTGRIHIDPNRRGELSDQFVEQYNGANIAPEFFPEVLKKVLV